MSINCFGQKKPETSSKHLDYSKIIGIWTNGEGENATFQIKKDSIFYVDFSKQYAYKIINDSLTIFFDGYIDVSKIEKITNDSLILLIENERHKFWKFKN